jgi:chitin synthase
MLPLLLGFRCHPDHPQKIIYLSIAGPLMLAALFEWFLWLGAFLYCLVKVWMKADHWSVRVLAVVMIILFTVIR